MCPTFFLFPLSSTHSFEALSEIMSQDVPNQSSPSSSPNSQAVDIAPSRVRQSRSQAGRHGQASGPYPPQRTKFWVFTINNPDEHQGSDPHGWPDVDFAVYQRERGSAGTEHFQGYVGFQVPKRFNTVAGICRYAHWEPRMGTHQQAIKYCTKEDTRIPGQLPVTIGKIPSATQGPIEQCKLSDHLVVEDTEPGHWSVFLASALIYDSDSDSDASTIDYTDMETPSPPPPPSSEICAYIDLTKE